MYIKLLWDLEQEEISTQKKRQRIKEIEEELKIESEIKLLKDQLGDVRKELEVFLRHKKSIESDIEDSNKSLINIMEMLESKKPRTIKDTKRLKKEQDALAAKIESLKLSLEAREKEIRDHEEKEQLLSKKIEEDEETLKVISKEYKELEKEVKEESKQFQKEFKEKVKGIPFAVISKYMEVKEDFPHGAIAQVEQGYCGNCGSKIPLEVIEAFKKGTEEQIVRCEVCGKILFYQ